jgi:hypothetical protein
VLTNADREIITSFLEASRDLSPERAAEKVEGISGATIRRYRAGNLPSRLESDTRLAMKRFISLHATQRSLHEFSGDETTPIAPTPTPAADSGPTAAREAYALLYASIRAGMAKDPEPGSEAVKMLEDQLGAAIDEAETRGWDPDYLYALLGRLRRGDL